MVVSGLGTSHLCDELVQSLGVFLDLWFGEVFLGVVLGSFVGIEQILVALSLFHDLGH